MSKPAVPHSGVGENAGEPLGAAVQRVAPAAALMFIQHAIAATWTPILPLHLKDLGFSNTNFGHLYGILSIATILSPWITGQIADRLLSAPKVIAISNVLAAIAMWLLASETRYSVILPLLFAFQLLYMPTFALCNHIAFSRLRDGARNFGYVRMFGTAGWVSGALLMTLWLHKPDWLPGAAHARVADGLRMGACIALLTALLSCLLPGTPPARHAQRRFAGLGALALIRQPDVGVLILVSFLISLTLPFVHPHGGLFLRSLGVEDANVGFILSFGQMLEVFGFLAMSTLIRRFTFKTLVLIGLTAWVLRFAIWTIGEPFWMVGISMALHGVSYAYVFGLGMSYLDQRASADVRSSVQSLHLVVTSGLGMWPANLLAAWVCDAFRLPSGDVNYLYVFWVPLAIASFCWLLFATLFRIPDQPRAAGKT